MDGLYLIIANLQNNFIFLQINCKKFLIYDNVNIFQEN
jgi:hypothetical protein